MNKLINDFVARATVRKQHTGSFGLQQVEENFDKERFTQLLVDECRIVVAEHFHECLSAVKMDAIIKDHFGIK